MCVCVCVSTQCVQVESLVKAALRRVCAPTMAPATLLTARVSVTLDGSERTVPNVRLHNLSSSLSLLSVSPQLHQPLLCVLEKNRLKLFSSVAWLGLRWPCQPETTEKKLCSDSIGFDINYPSHIEQSLHTHSITRAANEGTEHPETSSPQAAGDC